MGSSAGSPNPLELPTPSPALIQTPPQPVMSPNSRMSHAQGPARPSLGYQSGSELQQRGGSGWNCGVFCWIGVREGSPPLCCRPYSNQQLFLLNK